MTFSKTFLLPLVFGASLLSLQGCSPGQSVRITTTISMEDNKERTKEPNKDTAQLDHSGYVGLVLVDNSIAYVFNGSPAQKAGIACGDKILDVNDRSTVDLKVTEIANMVTGPVGTSVVLVLEHGTDRHKLVLTREEPVPEEARRTAEIQSKHQKAKSSDQSDPSDKSATQQAAVVTPLHTASDSASGGTPGATQDKHNLPFWNFSTQFGMPDR